MPQESPYDLKEAGDFEDTLLLSIELGCNLQTPAQVNLFIAAALVKQNQLLQQQVDLLTTVAVNTTP